MAKIVLGKRPANFKKTVTIPMLDGTKGTIECVFKYRTKREFGEMVDDLFNQGKTNQEEAPAGEDAPKFSVAEALAKAVDANAKYLLQLLEGWNLDVDLSEEALEQLSDELPGAAAAIMETYRAACTEGRLGN